jgi:hypothetical protein
LPGHGDVLSRDRDGELVPMTVLIALFALVVSALLVRDVFIEAAE